MKELEQAITFLKQNAESIGHGELSVKIIFYNSKPVRVETTITQKKQNAAE